jgi:hypothetical protein
MLYVTMSCIVMFIGSIATFVYAKNFKYMKSETIVLGLSASFLASLIWFITIPAAIIIGGAYFVSKLFTLDWKSKNESNRDN